ncbi:hypothetical protein Tco_0684635 [Tanacetum coccineum]
MAEEVGRWKLGLIILEDAERKLEIVVAVEREVPYFEEKVRGVENKSSMGSMLIAKGEECLDGCVEASRGEVKGGGVEFGVTKSLLGEIPRESTEVRESGWNNLELSGWCRFDNVGEVNRTGFEKPMEPATAAAKKILVRAYMNQSWRCSYN